MRIHNHFLFLSALIVILLAFACTSDPKAETETLPAIEGKKNAEVIAEATPAPIAPTPSAAEIAAAKEEKIATKNAANAALKAAKKKEKEEAASKERKRKRREKRKKRAAEKAAQKEAAEAAAKTTVTEPSSSSILKSPVQEDLSDIDPELLEMVQVKSNGGTPQIRFDSDSFDFGRIIEGKEIDHQFEFTNTGSAPLVINNVEATCGCTTPFYPFIPIEPGERGKISVHFNSKGRLGNQNPTITVYTNTDPGTFELQLKGIIDTERKGQ